MERKCICELCIMALGILALGIMVLGILALGKLSCNRKIEKAFRLKNNSSTFYDSTDT